jgi:hypothetical protein
MKVYALAKKYSVTHGHGSCGTDVAIPYFDSYTQEKVNTPIFRDLDKAEEYLLNSMNSFLHIVSVELI